MVDYLLRCGTAAGPAAAVDRDAAARVRPGRARRPHASGCGDRADLDARRPPRSPRRRSATRRCGSTTSGPASTCHGGSPTCSRRTRRRARCCSSATGSSPGARRARRATGRRSSSSPEPPRQSTTAGERSLRPRRPQGRGAAGGDRDPPSSASALPALRGALLADADGVVLEVDRSPEAVAFASSAARARGEPDRRALPGPSDQHEAQAARRRVRSGDGRRRRAARDAFRARRRASTRTGIAATTSETSTTRRGSSRSIPPARASCSSRASASSRRAATRAGAGSPATSTTARSRSRTRPTRSAASARSSESEAFAIEYWPLERYKLAQAPPRGELAGRVALITGGASGIGRAAARLLAERGAHVVVADLNLPRARRRSPRSSSRATGSVGRSRSRSTSPTRRPSQEMTRRAVLEYGGIDILVASAGLATSAPITETTLEEWELNYAVLARGYFLAARETFRVLLEQGRGGSIVFVASKNALVAGANAAAYSSAKAASLHLARCLAEEGGPHGIRVNTVNPDAVIQGSAIWSSDWKAERASTYGVTEDDLPGLLPRAHEARRERLPRGRRRGDRLPRRPALGEVDRQHPQRRRRRHRRVPAMSAQPGPRSSSSAASRRATAASRRSTTSASRSSRATVHALVGENGAGKSTLVKILTGVVQPGRAASS